MPKLRAHANGSTRGQAVPHAAVHAVFSFPQPNIALAFRFAAGACARAHGAVQRQTRYNKRSPTEARQLQPGASHPHHALPQIGLTGSKLAFVAARAGHPHLRDGAAGQQVKMGHSAVPELRSTRGGAPGEGAPARHRTSLRGIPNAAACGGCGRQQHRSGRRLQNGHLGLPVSAVCAGHSAKEGA